MLRRRTFATGGIACSSRYTEPSEASGEAGGTEASLRVGALEAPCQGYANGVVAVALADAVHGAVQRFGMIEERQLFRLRS